MRARGIPADRILLPRRHCVLVARYAGLVTELRGNIFRDSWMTPKRFQLEKLQGKRGLQGERSIRLNRQFRLILRLETDEQGKLVCILDIEDYH